MPEVTDKNGVGGSYAILPLECTAHDNFQILLHYSSSPHSCVIFFSLAGWLAYWMVVCAMVKTKFRKSASVCACVFIEGVSSQVKLVLFILLCYR